MGVSSCLPLQDVVASEAPGASADPPKDDIAVCHLGVHCNICSKKKGKHVLSHSLACLDASVLLTHLSKYYIYTYSLKVWCYKELYIWIYVFFLHQQECGVGVSSCLPLQDVVASEAPGASADPPKDDIAVCHLRVRCNICSKKKRKNTCCPTVSHVWMHQCYSPISRSTIYTNIH